MSAGPAERGTAAPWNDTSLTVAERLEALIAAMTLREKLAQLYGVWIGASPAGGDVAPFQHELVNGIDFDALIQDGLGQMTRPFGSAPVDPAVGAISLARTQRRIAESSRLGIPAIAHEECLAGFTAWGATAYPVPLSWGATFDPQLIEEMASRIGHSMRSVGVHQGLAPVLDVVLDPRWGRVEEAIGEDPYLVGTIASAYVRGLQSTGIIATLKHFIGYSASRAGRNLAPVSMGPREFTDVLALPFEMAVRETGVRSVMSAYTDVDGVPAAANRALLTGLLRETWGFDGTVVADYFGVTFLRTLHAIAGSDGEAAAAALSAGVDVEVADRQRLRRSRSPPRRRRRTRRRRGRGRGSCGRCCCRSSSSGCSTATGIRCPTASPRATSTNPRPRAGGSRWTPRRTATMPADVGRAGWCCSPTTGRCRSRTKPANGSWWSVRPRRTVSRSWGATRSPVTSARCTPKSRSGSRSPRCWRPCAGVPRRPDQPYAGGQHRWRGHLRDRAVRRFVGRDQDLIIAMLGDRAGLFGRGTSGEGCDAASMRLPGRQHDLLERLLDTGVPVVVGLIEGRPYALGTAPERAAAIVASFFPGEEGASAIAGVLSGRVEPSGRLPVSVPATPDGQPTTYLGGPLAHRSGTSNLDPTARFPFGHGLTYTTFDWVGPTVGPYKISTDGSATVGLTIRNVGNRAGVEVIQLYLHDPVASVVRPVNRLVGYAHVPLAAGESATVTFEVPADVSAFTGRDGNKIVEPGLLELRLGASSGDVRMKALVELTGATRLVDNTRRMHCDVKGL